MWSMDSVVQSISTGGWEFPPLLCSHLPTHLGKCGKQAGCCTACFYRSVLFTELFRRPSPHLNILLFSISVKFCPSRLCVLVTEERQMPAAHCAGGRDSLCWNLLEHLSLVGKKSWAREFPVFCSQWKSFPGESEKVIVSAPVCPDACLLGTWCCWLVVLLP